MLALNRSLLLALVGSVVILVLVSGCGERGGPGRGSFTPGNETIPDVSAESGVTERENLPSQTGAVVIGYARYPTFYGSSLLEMVKKYDTIIVGRVAGVAVPFDPRPGFLGEPTPELPPPGHPKASVLQDPDALSRPPGRMFTTYTIEVLRSIKSSVSAGDSILVTQAGGMWEGRAHQLEGDPVLEIGSIYLFFLQKDDSAGDYTGIPFGRFKLDAGGRIRVVDERWHYLPAVAALDGLSVDEAVTVIGVALAHATKPE